LNINTTGTVSERVTCPSQGGEGGGFYILCLHNGEAGGVHQGGGEGAAADKQVREGINRGVHQGGG